jgi:hypothetical protein
MNESNMRNDKLATEGEKKSPSMRRCAVTKESLPKNEMIRFVATPENKIIADLKEDLPSRGVWIKRGKSYVEKALEKNIFSKALKKKVNAEKSLANQLESLIKVKILNLLGLAKKAGFVIVGFEKVCSCLQKNESGLLLFAKDGAENSRSKIEKMAKQTEIFDIFTSEEISEALGRVNCVNVFVKESKMRNNLQKHLQKLHVYINN